MPMKIAITSFYLPSGSKIGVGYMVHYLANELVRRGHSVTVFSHCGPSEESLYRVVQVPCGNRLRTFRFAAALRGYDFSGFDVINAHGDDWFLWGCKLPRHIHTFHGSCLAEMLHASTIAVRVKMAALALCEFGSAFLADERVAVSANTRRYVPRIDHIIPNGVDLAQFTPGERKSEQPSILFVGTLHGRKRGAMLLDLFQRAIRPTLPEAQLWAVCETPAKGENVRYCGRLALPELIRLYRQAWVFCLPSTYEGFGVPYLEAMACGTPVVASPNPGAREVTRNGACGLLASDRNLGATLLRVLLEPALREALREAGLKRALEFDLTSICGRYERLYQSAGQGVSSIQ
jgi:glycosyltransferase involved in cell wall biosynthesis